MSRPIRILELRSVLGTGGGPEKTILLGAALTDRSRFAVTVCYIRDLRDSVFKIDRRASEINVDYVEVRERHSYDFAIWSALRKIIREREIQIVHSHDYKTNFYAWLLGKVESIIPLATVHGYTGHHRRERIYYAADKRVLSRFPQIIAVSGELKQELVRTGSCPDRIITILNGIDDQEFFRDESLRPRARAAFNLREEEFVIGAVGRLEPQKRFDLLLEAFAALRRDHPPKLLRLMIAGDGSLRQNLDALTTKLRLGDACLLLGDRADIPFLHHAFDLFVQSSDYEGTPNAVLEAMAFETPIVATDVGGTRELVSDGIHGLVVPPGSAAALSDAIARVWSDRQAARNRAVAARRRVEQELSFRARMRSLENVYTGLVGGGAHSGQ